MANAFVSAIGLPRVDDALRRDGPSGESSLRRGSIADATGCRPIEERSTATRVHFPRRDAAESDLRWLLDRPPIDRFAFESRCARHSHQHGRSVALSVSEAIRNSESFDDRPGDRADGLRLPICRIR